MHANPAANQLSTAAADIRQAAPSNRLIADAIFLFGRRVRDHLQTYPAIFADRTDAEGVALRRKALDTCCRLAREFEWLAFQAFANGAFTEVNREHLEAVVMDLRERVAALNLQEQAA